MAANRELTFLQNVNLPSEHPEKAANVAVIEHHLTLLDAIYHHMHGRFKFFLGCCTSAKLLNDIIKIEGTAKLRFGSASHQMGSGYRRGEQILHYDSNNKTETKKLILSTVLNQNPLEANSMDAAHVCAIGLSSNDFNKAIMGIKNPGALLVLETIYNGMKEIMGLTNLMPAFINQSAVLDRKIDNIQIEVINSYIGSDTRFSYEEIYELAVNYYNKIYDEYKKIKTNIEREIATFYQNPIYDLKKISQDVYGDLVGQILDLIIKLAQLDPQDKEFNKKFISYLDSNSCMNGNFRKSLCNLSLPEDQKLLEVRGIKRDRKQAFGSHS